MSRLDETKGWGSRKGIGVESGSWVLRLGVGLTRGEGVGRCGREGLTGRGVMVEWTLSGLREEGVDK